MVIQRWQSVLLLLAAVAMGIFPFVSTGVWVKDGIDITYSAMLCHPMLVTGVLACVLYIIDIFLYKNFKQQKSTLGVAQLMSLVTLVCLVYQNVMASSNGYDVNWLTVGVFMPVVALLLGFWARKRIKGDERLLKAADRLR